MQEQIKEEYIAKIFVCVVSVNFVHKKMAEIVKQKKIFLHWTSLRTLGSLCSAADIFQLR